MVHEPDQSMHGGRRPASPATRMHAAVAHDEATKVQYVYIRCVHSRWRGYSLYRGRRSLSRYIWEWRYVVETTTREREQRLLGAHARHVHCAHQCILTAYLSAHPMHVPHIPHSSRSAGRARHACTPHTHEAGRGRAALASRSARSLEQG
jgi:hypothetical protein